MLEIQPFDAWAEANATTDTSEKIKQYADYVRTSAYKNGQLDDTAEQEIQQGIVDRARVDGLISDEEPEKDRNQKLQGLLAPSQNKDADAKFLLDHYQNDFAKDSPEFLEKAPTIQQYLSLKQTSPNVVGELQGLVDSYIGDRAQVKNARLSAVDRGDYRVVAVDEDGGRQLYTGADTKPDNLNGELDTLINNGAISASDLNDVKKLTMPINGGNATVAEGTRYNVFANSIENLAKKDPTLRSSLDQEAARIREAKRTEQLTTGETIFDYVKKAVAIPLDAIGNVVTEAFGIAHHEDPVAAPSELIGGNKAITDRFSSREVNQFLGDYLKHASGPYYRADRPETGLDTDSLGNVIVSPALIGNKTQFEQALKMAPLNEDQKERATIQRQAMLETEAPKILKLILGESSEATSAYAVARAAGKQPYEFIEEWVGNNAQNYDGMSERLQQLGMSTFSAIATLPVGIGALIGIEPAAKALVAMNKDQSDREEYARLFGDEFGLGFQLVNTIPQVATDILATIGTEGLYTGLKGVVKGGSKAIVREATRGAMSMVDGATSAVVKEAAAAGGEALVGEALEKVGGSLATNLSKADKLVPLFATSFTRSAASTYGSIYGQLPDTMSADEKHKNAFGYAIASGLSTAVITSGMSFLGEGGIEDLATGKFRPITAADDAATNVRKVPLGELNYKQAKFLYENLENAGAKLADKKFQKVLTANIGGAYKNYIRTTIHGAIDEGFEEALDQAVQNRIEDAALHKNTPLSERVNQIWSAFALGGLMGGFGSGIGQVAKPLDQSEMSLALDARATVLSKVANDLRKTGSTATAEVLQRQLNDAQSAANAQRQAEIAAQQRKEVQAKTTEVVTQADKPFTPEAVTVVPTATAPATFEPSGQGELPLGDTRAMVLPEKTRFLTDFDGERAYLGSYAGTLEVDGDAVRLNLDEPRADGVTHLEVGNRFQPIDRSGIRLDRKRLMLTGEHDGTIPAGTPYAIPDPKQKFKYALPLDPANVSFVQDMANAPALRINNARIIGQENVSSPIILTDKGQIEDALRYYNLDPAVLMQPENIVQLELNLFDDAPAVEAATTPVANPTAVTETPVAPVVDAAKKGRGRKGKGAVAEAPLSPTAPSETAPEVVVADAIETGVTPTPEVRTEEHNYVRNLIIENPLTEALLSVKANKFNPEEINSVANGFAPEVFSDLKNRIDEATKYAMGLDDSLSEVRTGILASVGVLEAIYNRVKIAQFIEAKPAAVVEAAPIVEEAPVPVVASERDVEEPAQMTPQEFEDNFRKNASKRAAGLTPEQIRLQQTNLIISNAIGYSQAGIRFPKPFNIEAAESLGIKIPEGYEAVGELYVYKKPVLEEAPAPIVAPIAETPTTKKTRAKKQSVTPLPETTVVSNAENPSDKAANLQEELTNLNTTVPVFDVDGELTTLESLDVQLQQLDNKIEAARTNGLTVPSGVITIRKRLNSSVNKARFAVEGKATEIKAKIEELTAPDPDVDVRTDAQKNAEELFAIMRGEAQVSPQVAAAAAAVKPTPSKFKEAKGVGPVGFKGEATQPIAVFKDGVFRNAEEANLYTNWLAGGFAISNLAEHGFDPKKVSGVDFQSHSTEIKQRLWKDIQERFPFIPIPEGTPTTKSKRRVAYMTKAGDNYIDVPYEADSDGKPVRGVFTNNPLITAQQIDMGLMIVIPKSVATSAGFSKNPSIDVKATGKGGFVVTGVKRHPFDTGVFNAGDISLVGKSGYTPKKAMTSLGDFLRPPASQYLDGAGPSARNRANNTFETYMNDMMSVSNESNVVNKVTGERRSSFGSFENLISNSFGLSEDRGREAMSEAQIAYANNLKEYALAKKIQSALAKAQLKDSSATLIDLNLPKIILEETVSKGQVTPKPNEVADAIKKVYGLTGSSAEGVISNYGQYLYDSITSGELSVGVKPFRTHLISAANRYQVSEIRRNSRARGNSATTQEEYELTLNSLIDPKQDVVESAIRLLDTSTLNQLANTLRTNTKAYDSLFKIVQKSFPDTSEDMDEVELIDMAGTILGNYQKEESIKLARDLQNSPEGLDLANALIDVGWLPPLSDRVVTPKQTAGTPTQVKPLPEGATLAQKQQRVRLTKRVVKAAEGIHFSEADGRMLADEARKVNNAEIKRLGIVSNDPESVIAALRDLQESGTSMQRLVAGVLTANVDLIRNVRFVIGDMNDVRFAGAFMPKSNLVAINISGHNGRGIVDVLLHEYLHAVTVQTMTNPRTPAQVAALQRIASLRALTASQAAKMGLDTEGFESAFTDDLEFVTLALTAPEFQSLVRASTPTAQRSLLSRIWESLRSLFGYATTDKKMADAFDELLDFTQMFAGANTFNIKAERNLRLDAHKIEEGLGVLREYAKFRGQLRSNSNVLLTAKEQAQVVGNLISPIASLIGSTNTRPLSMFRSQAAIEDMINGKGGVLGGLTVAADGTVPWQSLSAKIAKGFSKGEASLVIPSLEGLVVNGRIDADKAITNLQALASARVSISELSEDQQDPYKSKEVSYLMDRINSVEQEIYDKFPDFYETNYEDNEEFVELNQESKTLEDKLDLALAKFRSDAAVNPNVPASKKFRMVNPKSLNKMEDVRDIVVENPSSEILFNESLHYPNRNNIIGFGRSYTETLPNGQKATFLFEVQSDWATKGDTSVEPLLAAYETLVLKSAISDAISRGQNYVVLPDAETAMITEGHDALGNLNEFGRPRTEVGMRAAYAPRTGRLHILMSRLTKTNGESVDMGRMQQDASVIFGKQPPSKLLSNGRIGVPKLVKKATATGIAYDLSNVDGRELSMLFSVARQDAVGGVAIDTESHFKDQLPKGINLRMDSEFKGIAGISREDPNVMHFNKEHLDGLVAGLNERAAKARIRGLANHEVAHFAALNAFTPEHIARVANELGEDQLQKVAEQYYSTAGLTAEETLANIKADRESGILSNERLADEWIRMQIEKAVAGQTYEDVIKGTNGNRSLIDTIVEAIKAFVTRLRQSFVDYPSAETAAAISHASRTLAKINKSGSIDFDANLFDRGAFGDTANLFASLDGSPVGDQVSYAIPILSSKEGKAEAITERLKLYNLPSQLRDVMNLRSGTVNQIAASSKALVKYFPKYRDLALKGGVPMEDIKLLFGTTAPPLTDSDLKEIADKTQAFEATIPDTETDGRKADLAAEYSEKLKRERRLEFNNAFVKLQKAAEQSITDAGFGKLVKEAIAFREDINTFKGLAGFDDSNDVYLTRAYKFFNTEGWALAAKMGGIIKIDGKDVDFGKLRDAAAAAYYEESEAEFQKIGKPYTNKDVTDLTLNKLDNYLSTLETMNTSVDRQVVDSIRKDLNRFKPKKDIDSTFRELLGEIEDPLANAVNTLYRVGMLSANETFRKDFAKTAIDLGLASKDAKAGWVTPYAASSAKRTGDLAGLYFDPKVAGVLNEVFGANMKKLNSNSTNIMNKLGRVAMGVSGTAIQMKTQFGIGYWTRNAIGGFVLSSAQGIFMNPLSVKGKQAMNQSWKAAFASLPTEQAERESILRLVQLNVLNDQSQGRVAQDLLRGLIATPEQDLQDLMASLDEARATKDAGGVFARIQQNGYLKGGLDKALSGYSNVTDRLAALDGAVDGMFKANAYYYELDAIKKHFGSSMTAEQQEEAAARKVKLTFAGNSQVIDLVKSFNKTPMAALFLPFARWKSEVFRTMLNTIPLAMEEIGQGGVMARRGVQRLAGFIGTLSVAPAVIGTASTAVFRALTGDDEDEERELTAVELAALRESLPQWQRGHQIKAQILKGGKIQFIDMSYILPHSQLTDMVAIITDGIKTGEGISASRLASYVTGDLIGTQIAATSIDEILNNADDRGQPIYLETDNAALKMQRMFGHYAKGALVPSIATKGIEFGREGQTNREELLFGELLGSRPKTVTFGDVERRGFRNLKGLLDNSVSIIGDLTSGRFKSDSEIDDVVDRHQDALNETQRRLNRFMHSMVSMGSPESSVYSSAKMYKFSDDTIGSAYQGYRIAWRPNDKWNQKTYFNAEQAKEQDPMQKLQSINRSVNRKGAINYVNDAYDE
jgi:hypothetical protein